MVNSTCQQHYWDLSGLTHRLQVAEHARLGAQGLAVVGVTTDAAERAAVFAERLQMRYPVVVDDAGETSRAERRSATDISSAIETTSCWNTSRLIGSMLMRLPP